KVTIRARDLLPVLPPLTGDRLALGSRKIQSDFLAEIHRGTRWMPVNDRSPHRLEPQGERSAGFGSLAIGNDDRVLARSQIHAEGRVHGNAVLLPQIRTH